MARTSAQFLFDVGSPNAFLSHLAIPAIEARTGTKFEYVPVLLGGIFKATNNKSRWPRRSPGIKNKRDVSRRSENQRALRASAFSVKPIRDESVLSGQHPEP